MELKKTLGASPKNVPVTADIDERLEHHCRALFDSFEKIDYMRIDGRITKDGFRLIELTPDVHLGPSASFAQAMMSTGISYDEMWAELLLLGTQWT
jgi:D-alanine-D-alanine ligase-like ATP-grasp enzyme